MDVHFIYFKKIILLEWKVRKEGTRDSESESVVMKGSRLMEIHHSMGMVPGCDACKYDKNPKQVKLSALVNFVSCHSEKARTPQCHSFKLFHMALFFIFDLPSGRLTRLGLFLEGLWLQVAVASSFVTTHQARRHGVFEGGHEKSPPKTGETLWKPEMVEDPVEILMFFCNVHRKLENFSLYA